MKRFNSALVHSANVQLSGLTKIYPFHYEPLSLKNLLAKTYQIKLSWRFGATTFSIMTLSITTFSITTLSITTFSITTFSITTLSITTFSITTLNITSFSITTLSMTTFRIIVWYVTLSLIYSQYNDIQHNCIIWDTQLNRLSA